MNDKDIVAKIKEIQDKFLAHVRLLEKQRDEQVKAVKKGIDQRKIEKLLQDLKTKL